MNIRRMLKSEIGTATRRTRMFYLLVCYKKRKDKSKQYYNNLGYCFIKA